MTGTSRARRRRNPAIRINPEEAAMVELVLRRLVTGHTVWHDMEFLKDDATKLRLIRSWLRFARFGPVNAARPVEATAPTSIPKEVAVQ